MQLQEDRKKYIVIGGLVGLFIVLAIVLVVLLFRRNPLEKGVTNLVKEVLYYEKESADVMGVEQAYYLLAKGDPHLKYSVNVSGIPELSGYTVGMDGTYELNRSGKTLAVDSAVTAQRVPIISAGIYADEQKMYVTCPQIFDGSIVVDTEDVDDQWNNSVFSSMLGYSIQEDLDLKLFEPFDVDENILTVRDYKEDLAKMESRKLTEEDAEPMQINLTRMDGTVITAQGYEVVYDKQETAYIYLDNKNRIVALKYTDDECTVTASMLGTTRTLDRIELVVDGDLTSAALEKGEEAQNNAIQEELKGLNEDYASEMHLDLVYTAGVKDFELTIEDLSIYLKGQNSENEGNVAEKALYCTVTGVMTGSAAQNPANMPSGEEYRILEMDMMELLSLAYSWRDGLSELVKSFFN